MRQPSLFQAPSEWVPPENIPNLEDATEIAIDLETHDPNLKTTGPGWAIKKGKVIGKKECGYQVSISKTRKEQGYRPNETNATKEVDITTPESDEAIKMNGSYTGFQPKPAVEVVIVVRMFFPLEGNLGSDIV